MNKRRCFYEDEHTAREKSNKSFIVLFSLLVVMILLLAGILIYVCYDAHIPVLNRVSDVDIEQDNTVVDSATEETVESVNQELSLENAELERLNQKFVDIFKSKYPSVELSFLIKNLDTGAFTVYNDKKMNSASIIKLFIMETVFDKLAEENYVLTDDREVALTEMITESDNKAANLFIDDFGGDNENRKVEAVNEINKNIAIRGYANTELNRKMHDVMPPGGPSGYQNYTSVTDVCTLLEGIYDGTRFSKPYNEMAMDMLKNQQRRSKIPNKIVRKYENVTVANKTGELAQVENDAAIIMSDEFNLIFVVLTDGIPKKSDGNTDYNLKEQVQRTIADLGLELVKLYKTNEFELER